MQELKRCLKSEKLPRITVSITVSIRRLVVLLLLTLIQGVYGLGSYTPYMTKCPPGTLLRQGGNISSSEAAYIAAK
jgi:hypothetical protein